MPLRILLLTAYFPPDTGSAPHLFYELGTALARRHHEVWVATGFPSYHAQGDVGRYRRKLWMREHLDSLSVIRVVIPQLPRYIPLARGVWQMASATCLFLPSLRVPRPDVVLIYSPPLPLGLTGWALEKLRKVPFVLNVQDLFPQSAIDLGILRNHIMIRFFERMERFLYKSAAHITVHSPGNREHAISKGASPGKVTVMPNWVDTDFLAPGPKNNELRKKLGLEGKFVVSFAGVIGYSQDLDTVLEAARRLAGHPEIVFLIVGDGVEKPRLQKKAEDLSLTNVLFLPMQPRHRYPQVIQASDVSLATLHAEVKTPVVPSKILSIMAGGRPVIATMDLSGDAPKLIREARCGLVLSPGDAEGLAEVILKLYSDRGLCEEMGLNGRCYAEQHLSLHLAAERYENLFTQVLSET
jgi:glycosyltransferase involved in cell wall biosynthesis